MHVAPKSPKGWLKRRIFTFGVAFHFFVAGNRRHCKLNMWGRKNCPWLGRGQVMWPITKFGGSNHITGTAEPKVVKFCTRVGYINSNNRMTYHQQNGRGYGHVTFKILPLVVMQCIVRVFQQRQLIYLSKNNCSQNSGLATSGRHLLHNDYKSPEIYYQSDPLWYVYFPFLFWLFWVGLIKSVSNVRLYVRTYVHKVSSISIKFGM